MRRLHGTQHAKTGVLGIRLCPMVRESRAMGGTKALF
jgi:hypothetical protein